MKIRGKDNLGRPIITSYQHIDIPIEYRLQASDVTKNVRIHIMDHINIKTHTDLALECIELTLSRPGIHGL